MTYRLKRVIKSCKNKLLSLIDLIENDQKSIIHYDMLNNNYNILLEIPKICEKIDYLLSVETLIN